MVHLGNRPSQHKNALRPDTMPRPTPTAISEDPYGGKCDPTYLAAAEQFATKHKATALELLELRPGHKVIDIGCGLGADLARIVPLIAPDGHAVGIDSNPLTLATAKVRLDSIPTTAQVDLRVADVYRIPFPDNYFDAAHAERLFLHLAEPVQAIREVARVLKPGGRFVVTETDGGSRSVDSRFNATERKLAHFWALMRKNGYAGRQMFRLLTEADFSGVSAHPTAYHTTDYLLYRTLSRCDVDERQAQKKRVTWWWPLRRFNKELERNWRNGSFFYSFVVVTVAGEVAK